MGIQQHPKKTKIQWMGKSIPKGPGWGDTNSISSNTPGARILLLDGEAVVVV